MSLLSFFRTCFASAFLFGACALPAHSATYTVTNTSNSGGGSLRQALAQANASPAADTITFAKGLGGTITLSGGALPVTSPLTIQGPGATTLTLSGNGTNRLFNVSGDGVAIRGLTLSGGKQVGGNGANGGRYSQPGGNGGNVQGGAIYNSGTLSLANIVLTDNNIIGGNGGSGGPPQYGGRGGGPSGRGGTAQGGAIYNSGTLTLTSSTLQNNSATGGIGGSSYFSGDGGVAQGGAIYNVGTLRLVATRVQGNKATGGTGGNGWSGGDGGAAQGGAIYNAGQLAQSNSTFSGNVAIGGAPGSGRVAGSNGAAQADDIYMESAPSPTATPSPTSTPTPTATPTSKPTATPVPNRAPVISSVVMSPTAPRSNTPLTVRVVASDEDKDALTYTYKWVNRNKPNPSNPRMGTVVRTTTSTSSSDTLSNSNTSSYNDKYNRGDKIEVSVSVSDGKTTSYGNATVTIQNSPIRVTGISLTTILATTPRSADKLTGRVKFTDPDNEAPHLTFVWTKTHNGKTTRILTTQTTSWQDRYDLSKPNYGNKGDVITLTVTASDGLTSSSLSRSITVGNTIPAMTGVTLSPSAPTTKSLVRATPKANDIDATERIDTLTYTYSWKAGGKLLADEKGASVDLSKYPALKAGNTVTVQVRASDGTALSASLSASVTIKDPATTKSSAAGA